MTWKTSLAFVAFASLLIIIIGWLISLGVLPIKQSIVYSNTILFFIQIWIVLAIFIGLIFPGIAFFRWIKHPQLRNIFGFYLLILLIQILTELVVSIFSIPSLVVIIGTIYTAFRVWQLWQSRTLVRNTRLNQFNYKLLNSLLLLLFLFWSSNLIMLLSLVWPVIV